MYKYWYDNERKVWCHIFILIVNDNVRISDIPVGLGCEGWVLFHIDILVEEEKTTIDDAPV